MKSSKTVASCPCGSGAEYGACCGRFIDHPEQAAPTAEALMRSRYTAYTRLDEVYLLRTWHPDTRPETLGLDEDAGRIKWLELDVMRSAAGLAGDQEGMVEFQARYKLNGRAMRIHEASCFLFVDGRWYYRDGEIFE